jgi:hypothetical protein
MNKQMNKQSNNQMNKQMNKQMNRQKNESNKQKKFYKYQGKAVVKEYNQGKTNIKSFSFNNS